MAITAGRTKKKIFLMCIIFPHFFIQNNKRSVGNQNVHHFPSFQIGRPDSKASRQWAVRSRQFKTEAHNFSYGKIAGI
jgi:hypothetical protein